MDGTLLDDIDAPDALADVVEKELLDLRGAFGVLTVQKFQSCPALRRVCGGGDLLDAFMMFERELRRYEKDGSRDERAAAISITAKAETVLDRMEHVVGALPQDGRIRDQRTGRRWSDSGIRIIAQDLVHLAEVQGRLGQELLTIEVSGDLESELRVDLFQMTTTNLDDTAPLVRIWRYVEDELEEATSEAVFDFERTPVQPTAGEKYQMKHYVLKLQMPNDLTSLDVESGEPVYSVSIEGRDSPMRTVTFVDKTASSNHFRLQHTNYRTISTVEITRL